MHNAGVSAPCELVGNFCGQRGGDASLPHQSVGVSVGRESVSVGLLRWPEDRDEKRTPKKLVATFSPSPGGHVADARPGGSEYMYRPGGIISVFHPTNSVKLADGYYQHLSDKRVAGKLDFTCTQKLTKGVSLFLFSFRWLHRSCIFHGCRNNLCYKIRTGDDGKSN
jgi:hypothetical protein